MAASCRGLSQSEHPSTTAAVQTRLLTTGSPCPCDVGARIRTHPGSQPHCGRCARPCLNAPKRLPQIQQSRPLPANTPCLTCGVRTTRSLPCLSPSSTSCAAPAASCSATSVASAHLETQRAEAMTCKRCSSPSVNDPRHYVAVGCDCVFDCSAMAAYAPCSPHLGVWPCNPIPPDRQEGWWW